MHTVYSFSLFHFPATTLSGDLYIFSFLVGSSKHTARKKLLAS